ncbi:FAD-dependent oxidoreductase [bacterium]|nr:FAD-dependent oxidoreductase [bacterium]
MSASPARIWRCGVCGYVHREAEPPECCPVCGAARSDFEAFAEERPAQPATANRWQCLNCSYIHEGTAPPDECPVCGAPRDRFVPLAEERAAVAAGEFTGHLVVVGAGIAGVAAVEAFRSVNPGGTITLLAHEPELPYYRLNLTRYLAGELALKDLPIHDAAWYSKRNIDVRLGAEAGGLLLDERRVLLHDGTALPFDRLVLAAGAHAFVPPLHGAHLDGVTCLRTLRDAEAIRARVKAGTRVVCIGGGLLGLETAGALAAQHADVTLLEGHEWLMPRQLNRRAGEILAQHISCIGVNVRRLARTQELLGAGHVTGVLLDDGARLPADMVVIATGVRPNSHLARRAGLDVGKGVTVNNHLVTSHPEVFAAGDVAEHRGVLYGSWGASQFQGSIAGMNAAGVATEFGGLPRSNTLKVLGVDMLSIGQFEPEDGSYTVLEAEDRGVYKRFVLRDGRLIGSVLVGDTAASARIRQAIERGEDFSRAAQEHATAEAFAACLTY